MTNLDVAASSAAGLSGNFVGNLREGNHMIPIVTRLRAAERGQRSDVESRYVASSRTGQPSSRSSSRSRTR